MSSLLATGAAIVSAIGGVFACIAAYRSAESAKTAVDAALESEKRQLLRQLTITAHEVAVESDHAIARAGSLKVAYQSLFMIAGRGVSGLEKKYLEEVDDKISKVSEIKQKATPFVNSNRSLLNGPVEEISKRETEMTKHLTEVRLIRDEMIDIYNQAQEQAKELRNNKPKSGA